ncbi:MAG: hypothetical protein DI587_39465 [Variovorax paradoxus]|nr:MAG: hypothetical protein DI583_39465 [Variovorax paradoxus]PZP98406.1 MAG: hypothetical protein DI587_39465 [Variovorax paradoxus]
MTATIPSHEAAGARAAAVKLPAEFLENLKAELDALMALHAELQVQVEMKRQQYEAALTFASCEFVPADRTVSQAVAARPVSSTILHTADRNGDVRVASYVRGHAEDAVISALRLHGQGLSLNGLRQILATIPNTPKSFADMRSTYPITILGKLMAAGRVTKDEKSLVYKLQR